MRTRVTTILFALIATALLLPAAVFAQQDLEVSQVDWETNGGFVQFHVQFHNYGALSSEPATGQVLSQPFGAHVPSEGVIGAFTVPSLAPDSFFDIFYDVAIGDLPPTADEINPWSPGTEKHIICGPDDHWDGNVDIFWDFGGLPGGSVEVHNATMLACPSFGNSYIHLVTGCPNPMFATLNASCPGWTIVLVNEDYTPAPSPLPPFWTGYVCASADNTVPLDDVCNFSIDFDCGGNVVSVDFSATACDCGPVPNTSSNWGAIKGMYR